MIESMAPPDIIAIAASHGDMEAISVLLNGLPRDLRASILLVLDGSDGTGDDLPQILASRTGLSVKLVEDGEVLVHGTCYLGGAKRRLMLDAGHRLRIPAESRGHVIDTLFSSVAQHLGRRSVGVVLSGALQDSISGLREIRRRGGITLVQACAEATKMLNGADRHLAGAEQLAAEIVRLVHQGMLTSAVVSAKWPKS